MENFFEDIFNAVTHNNSQTKGHLSEYAAACTVIKNTSGKLNIKTVLKIYICASETIASDNTKDYIRLNFPEHSLVGEIAIVKIN